MIAFTYLKNSTLFIPNDVQHCLVLSSLLLCYKHMNLYYIQIHFSKLLHLGELCSMSIIHQDIGNRYNQWIYILYESKFETNKLASNIHIISTLKFTKMDKYLSLIELDKFKPLDLILEYVVDNFLFYHDSLDSYSERRAPSSKRKLYYLLTFILLITYTAKYGLLAIYPDQSVMVLLGDSIVL